MKRILHSKSFILGSQFRNPLFFGGELLLTEAAKAHERDAHHHDPKVVGARPGVPQPLGFRCPLETKPSWFQRIIGG